MSTNESTIGARMALSCAADGTALCSWLMSLQLASIRYRTSSMAWSRRWGAVIARFMADSSSQRSSPPPRQNQTRYYGVFAAHARLRRAVTALVPTAAAASRPPRPRPHAHDADDAPRPRQPSRLPWAELFRRVFHHDLAVCPRCAGLSRVLAAITAPDVIAAILAHLDLPTAPLPTAPARAPPQLPFWPDGATERRL